MVFMWAMIVSREQQQNQEEAVLPPEKVTLPRDRTEAEIGPSRRRQHDHRAVSGSVAHGERSGVHCGLSGEGQCRWRVSGQQHPWSDTWAVEGELGQQSPPRAPRAELCDRSHPLCFMSSPAFGVRRALDCQPF